MALLETLAERYRRELTDSVVPFWLEHSLDRECGGYFSCLDRDGTVYDTKKYLWLVGREVWMFARLYNTFDSRPAYLEASALGIRFLREHAFDEKGRVYFSLTREGNPYAFQRKPYAAVFVCLALLEYGRAVGESLYREQAEALFDSIAAWIDDATLLDRPALAGRPPVSTLADVMVLAALAYEFAVDDDDPRWRDVMKKACEDMTRHYDADRRILVENVSLDGTDISGWPEGRFFIPGHAIETAWFILHLTEHVPDDAVAKTALDAIECALELGWDDAFGGIFYFMDVEGRPTLQLESSMKLWWSHTETIYALILAYLKTHDDRWLAWLEKVDRYTFDHFADEEFGGWFGYCDRRGNLTHTCKGGNYKGFFHVPRALLMSVQLIEKTKGTP